MNILKKKLNQFNKACWMVAERNNFEMTSIYNQVSKDHYLDCEKFKKVKEEDIEFKKLYSKAKEALPDLKQAKYTKLVIDYINEYIKFCRSGLTIVKTQVKSIPEGTKITSRNINMCRCGKTYHRNVLQKEMSSLKPGEQFRCECGEVVIFNPSRSEANILSKYKTMSWENIKKYEALEKFNKLFKKLEISGMIKEEIIELVESKKHSELYSSLQEYYDKIIQDFDLEDNEQKLFDIIFNVKSISEIDLNESFFDIDSSIEFEDEDEEGEVISIENLI